MESFFGYIQHAGTRIRRVGSVRAEHGRQSGAQSSAARLFATSDLSLRVRPMLRAVNQPGAFSMFLLRLTFPPSSKSTGSVETLTRSDLSRDPEMQQSFQEDPVGATRDHVAARDDF